MSKRREDHLHKGSTVSPYEALVSGSISGAVARAVTAPLDTIKIRLQLSPKNFKQRKSVFTIVKNLVQNEGLAALWKGNVPAEILYIIYGGVQFTSYSVLNKWLSQYSNLNSATHALVVGGGAGIASTLTTYPFDLLRTRLVANSERNFLSMTGTIKKIMKEEGIVGMFAGAKPAMLSVASTTALMFWSYELARDFATDYKHIPFIEGFCGFLAGATSKGITFPLDTLRKRCQMHSIVYGKDGASAITIFKNIITREGVFGLYKGFGISVLKTAPTSAISLFMYEYTLTALRRTKNQIMED
ncbi:mitochondrial thiamine pyrophosphate transporter [Spathaspora passalidarum NRRL Y-27907]|uniref:Mitochondrial thiamine pyrophosphate carrier 1 n=1 Tax=Spathaspora passalidarum (strain NRRL Y-27907 / 11-Y1) TaxID=619300 RepID=G3AL92_SPAPN|nr:mitochondrial thiamine pyrophosphate transporter [Spathaspora passalidarum NRRL Y-27907]EGW33136.1 mitochondrial thiamine pyrophosphate transporter [Spathaspora passalidarum NRRL Y-27907]